MRTKRTTEPTVPQTKEPTKVDPEWVAAFTLRRERDGWVSRRIMVPMATADVGERVAGPDAIGVVQAKISAAIARIAIHGSNGG